MALFIEEFSVIIKENGSENVHTFKTPIVADDKKKAYCILCQYLEKIVEGAYWYNIGKFLPCDDSITKFEHIKSSKCDDRITYDELKNMHWIYEGVEVFDCFGFKCQVGSLFTLTLKVGI